VIFAGDYLREDQLSTHGHVGAQRTAGFDIRGYTALQSPACRSTGGKTKQEKQTGRDTMKYRINRQSGDRISEIVLGSACLCEAEMDEAVRAL